MRAQRLMRTIYKTDALDEEPGYMGMFSDPIPAELTGVNSDSRIVSADWSKHGWVEVTWLIPGDR